ncbi:MAG: potassium-transporting ATPase subunit KdpA [Raoultibacter sp.]
MMTVYFEYFVYVALLIALAIPLSSYINAVMTGTPTFLSRVFVPVENFIYRTIGVQSTENMGWKHYLISVLVFSLISLVVLMALLMMQMVLPFNPQSLPGLPLDLAFNTAASFVSNTNWQAYGGETTLSYFSQAIGLAVQNFVTPAVGIAVLFAVFRGLVSKGKEGIGSFWADIVRATLYILIPLCLVMSVFYVSQGVPQNVSDYRTVDLVEPLTLPDGSQVTQESIPMGPQASQVAIKQLGTNGGGYNGANSASPLENPTPFTNLVQCLSLLLLPVALVFSFGRYVADKKQGRALFATMFILFLVALLAVAFFEQAGTPQLAQGGAVYMGQSGQSGGNMEGKETRFGVADSALWATSTTAASNGSVNSMLDSFTPIGGMVPLILMQLGEVIFGGVGSGLYAMLGFVILTVFIAGLMVGRTPEYLGKKIGPAEMRMAVILCITTPVVVLVGASVLCLHPATVESLGNTGIHGFSEVLYTATSAGANNGSAFAGFDANTPFINTVLGVMMLVNRFVPIAAACVLAGGLCRRPRVAVSVGTLSTSNTVFVFLLILIVLLIGALSMFPALALGPVAEQLQMAL